MRVMEVLPEYEMKRYNKPPVFTTDDRKQYFRLDEVVTGLLSQVREPRNKIGLLLQYGYFKNSGAFFSHKLFKPADIKFGHGSN